MHGLDPLNMRRRRVKTLRCFSGNAQLTKQQGDDGQEGEKSCHSTSLTKLYAFASPVWAGGLKRRNRNALPNTNTLESAMAPAANMGDNKVPVNG